MKDLLITMLDKDPSKRPTAIDLSEHPWFAPNMGVPEDDGANGEQNGGQEANIPQPENS